MTLKKALFLFLLLLLNGFGIGLIGLSFLGASNANGEGAPMESEFTSFLKRLLFAAVVSFAISLLSILLTSLFKNRIDYCLPKQNKVFLLQFTFLITVFLLIFLFLYIRFTNFDT